MKRRLLCVGLLASIVSVSAQMGTHTDPNFDNDTLKVGVIEDVILHKYGNPNDARVSTTKSNLTVMQTPQPIAIITHEIIEAQQAKKLSDIIQDVNGVYVSSSRGSSQDSFGARGFTFGANNILKNGLRMNTAVFPEVTGLERVEVLKGANAMMYGNVSAGGMLNLITKKPRFHWGGSVTTSTGSWNDFKPTFDIYGPLSESVAFRLDGAYEKSNSFRDFVKSNRKYLNPSFVFNLGENTQLIVEGDYLYDHFTPDFGLGTITDGNTGISTINRNLGRNTFLGTGWQYQTTQQATSDIILNHQFSNKWYLNAEVGYSNYTKDYFSSERIHWMINTPGQPDNSWLRPINRTYNEDNFVSGQVNLNGEFNTGKIVHKILVGSDANYDKANSYTYYNPATGQTYGKTSYYGINGDPSGLIFMNQLSDLQEGAMPEALKNVRTTVPVFNYGLYVQDFVKLTKEFNVLAGVRYSYLKNYDTELKDFKKNANSSKEGSTDHAFTPKVGLIYTPNDNLSLYATYTNSFAPNSGFDIDHQALKASTIDQYELGLKKNIIHNAVAFNLSLYQIRQKNAYASPYLANGSTADYKVFAGTIQSRGVEVDITGNPMKQLQLIGGFSYNHSVYTDTPADGFVEGQRIVRAPSTTINASAFYKFDHVVKGLIVGATAYYLGDSKGGYNDVKGQSQETRIINTPGFTTVDFSLGYEYHQFSIQAKLANAFNTFGYTVHENYSVNPSAPRSYYLTLTYKLF